MAVSVESRIASRRLHEIGTELLRLREEQLASYLKGPGIREIIIEPTIATLKIRRIKVVLESGHVLILRASGIEDILVDAGEQTDARIRQLEQEWTQLNKKWHMYP